MKNFSLISSLIILGIALSFSNYSCNNKLTISPKGIPDTLLITQINTALSISKDTLMITDKYVIDDFLKDSASTFVLLRHAEKADAGHDPILTSQGQRRAKALSRVLKNIPLTAVYSSDFKRTRETAQPFANNYDLSIQIYDPSQLNSFAIKAMSNHEREKVLVVGHSNSTPTLINNLIGKNIFSSIPHEDYNHLYLVNIFENGWSEVIQIKYGE